MVENFQFNSSDKLINTLNTMCKNKKCPKIRIFEFNKSYEDFSISFTLKKEMIFNFNVFLEDGYIILKKKDKRSTRHVKFLANSICEVEYMDKKKPYIAIRVQGKVTYTDGTSRY